MAHNVPGVSEAARRAVCRGGAGFAHPVQGTALSHPDCHAPTGKARLNLSESAPQTAG